MHGMTWQSWPIINHFVQAYYTVIVFFFFMYLICQVSLVCCRRDSLYEYSDVQLIGRILADHNLICVVGLRAWIFALFLVNVLWPCVNSCCVCYLI